MNTKAKMKDRKKQILIGIGIGAIIMLATSAFINNESKKKDSIAQANETNQEKIVEKISSIYSDYTIDQLTRDSDIILIGEITEELDPIEIEPVGGGDSRIFTDYKIVASEILKNTTGQSRENITLRTTGGEIDNREVIDVEMKKLKTGDKYLFFLKVENIGGGYTTDENYTSLLAGEQGLFSILDGVQYESDDIKGVKKEELINLIKTQEVNNIEKEDPLEGMQKNLESGFITQEEYDEMIKNTDEYAEIIEK